MDTDTQGEGHVTMAAETGGRDYKPVNAGDCWSHRTRGNILSWSLGREHGLAGTSVIDLCPSRNGEKVRLCPLNHLVSATSLEQRPLAKAPTPASFLSPQS